MIVASLYLKREQYKTMATTIKDMETAFLSAVVKTISTTNEDLKKTIEESLYSQRNRTMKSFALKALETQQS